MKTFPLICIYIILFLGCACSTHHPIVMANKEWKINDSTRYIHDSGLTWVLAATDFGFNTTSPMVAADYQLEREPAVRNYLSDVVRDVRLPIDTILLYLPMQKLIFATLSATGDKATPVSSIIFSDDDADTNNFYSSFYDPSESFPVGEKWMYGNIFPNFRDKRAVVAYRFPYNGKEMVILRIMQGETKGVRKLSEYYGYDCGTCSPFYNPYLNPSKIDFGEIVGWDVTKLKKQAVTNFHIGRRLKKLKE
ncbi:MAG: hypothetical protein K2G69_04965 [Muribaculaceae bacterium]|nr:hypothetical protein [Muribaculaceae bacterium]